MRLSLPSRKALLLCLCWVSWVSGQEAREQPSPEQQPPGQTGVRPVELVEVALEAPPECPDARALRDTVLRLASVGPGSTGGLVAHITIQAAGQARWSLTMQTEQNGRRGERTLEGPTCGALADAAALTLALMLNPEAQQPPRAAAPPSPPSKRAKVQRSRASRPLPQPAAEHVRVAGTAHVGVHAGALPRVGPDVALGIAGALGRGSVWLLGSYATPERKMVDQDRGGRLWMLAGTALGCWQAGPPSVVPCLGAAFNWIQGQGIVRQPRSGTVYWVSPAAGILADLPLGSWAAIRTAALGQVPLARPATYLDGIGPVHRPALAEGRLLAGLVVGSR